MFFLKEENIRKKDIVIVISILILFKIYKFIEIAKSYNEIETIFGLLGLIIGTLVYIVIFVSVIEKVKNSDIAHLFRGIPILLVIMYLIRLAFYGFSGFGLKY